MAQQSNACLKVGTSANVLVTASTGRLTMSKRPHKSLKEVAMENPQWCGFQQMGEYHVSLINAAAMTGHESRTMSCGNCSNHGKTIPITCQEWISEFVGRSRPAANRAK
jgi:hypothetical protein